MLDNSQLKKKCLTYYFKCSEKIKEAKSSEKFLKLFKKLIYQFLIIL